MPKLKRRLSVGDYAIALIDLKITQAGKMASKATTQKEMNAWGRVVNELYNLNITLKSYKQTLKKR